MNLTIEFEGFYESIHGMLIDDMIASYFDKDDILEVTEKEHESIPMQELKNKYARFYLGFVESVLKEKYNADINLHFKKVASPREYNFTTDNIIATNSGNDINWFVLDKAKKDRNFIKWLNEETKSRSGYYSFYDLKDALNNKDNTLHVYFFRWLLLENDNDFMSYYDTQCGYEMIYDTELMH